MSLQQTMTEEQDQQQQQQEEDQQQDQQQQQQYVIGSGSTSVHTVQLLSGTNIHCSLNEVVKQLEDSNLASTESSCYVISAIGSLSNVTIRTINSINDEYQENIRTWNEHLEIVSLIGTFGLQMIENPQVNNNDDNNDDTSFDVDNNMILNFTKNLRIVVSDSNGTCFGGHLIDGIIYTTIDLVFGSVDNDNNNNNNNDDLVGVSNTNNNTNTTSTSKLSSSLPRRVVGITKSKKKNVQHCLLTMPKKRKFMGTKLVESISQYPQFKCKGKNNTCKEKVRTYCQCTKGVNLCVECYAQHRIDCL
jgi:predicted DNA-binding protein with PD1-like motif